MRLLGKTILFATSVIATGAFAETMRGKVTQIEPPQTVVVVDAEGKSQCFSPLGVAIPLPEQKSHDAAWRAFRKLVAKRAVSVEWFPAKDVCATGDKHCPKQARILADGKDVGLELLRQGHAWHDRNLAGELSATDRMLYYEAHEDSRKHRRGLWKEPNPTPPWSFGKSGAAAPDTRAPTAVSEKERTKKK